MFHFDDALAAFRRLRVSTARLTYSTRAASFFRAVSSTDRLPRRGLSRTNIQSQVLTSYTLLPRLPSASAVSALPMGKPDPLCLLNLCGVVVERPPWGSLARSHARTHASETYMRARAQHAHTHTRTQTHPEAHKQTHVHALCVHAGCARQLTHARVNTHKHTISKSDYDYFR